MEPSSTAAGISAVKAGLELLDDYSGNLPATLPARILQVGTLRRIALAARQRGLSADLIRRELNRDFERCNHRLSAEAILDIEDQHLSGIVRLFESLERHSRNGSARLVEVLEEQIEVALTRLIRVRDNAQLSI